MKKAKPRRARKPRAPRPPVTLSIDCRYALYGGDVIECRKDEGEGIFTCEFVSAVPIRAELLGKTDQWTASGRWATMPHGIFDVEREV